jgi:hypothetical protein
MIEALEELLKNNADFKCVQFYIENELRLEIQKAMDTYLIDRMFIQLNRE